MLPRFTFCHINNTAHPPCPHMPSAPFTTSPLTPAERAHVLGQTAFVVWFTGLSGAGKSTLGHALERALQQAGRHTMLIDGDQVRLGLCQGLGFSADDRQENLRRSAELACTLMDAGLIVIATFITPRERDRALVRSIVGAQRLVEVYVSTPLSTCEARDPKGLYRRARQGEVAQMTGIGSPYEPPEMADVVLNGEAIDMAAEVDRLMGTLAPRWAPAA